MARIDPHILPFLEQLSARIGVEPAALCAVVEVEGGDPHGILYEKHKFPSNLRKLAGASAGPLIIEAKRQGLAVDKWLGRAQYADQRGRAGNIAILNRAMKIHREAALRSASYGAFQVLGSNYGAAGFESAEELRAAYDSGLPPQIESFVALAESWGAIDHLRARRWAAFAKIWNGAGFKKNAYDTKLAAAYSRWAAVARANGGRVSASVADAPAGSLRMGDKGPRVKALQEALVDKGYQVRTDSDFGPATRRAVAAAQVDFGLAGDGIATIEFIQRLEASEPIARGARELATVKDLKNESAAVDLADKAKKGVVVAGGGVAAADQVGILDQASGLIDVAKTQLDKLDGVKATLIGFGLKPSVLFVIAAGTVVWFIASRIQAARLEDHRSGRTV